jgi:hypothetical protein
VPVNIDSAGAPSMPLNKFFGIDVRLVQFANVLRNIIFFGADAFDFMLANKPSGIDVRLVQPWKVEVNIPYAVPLTFLNKSDIMKNVI